MYERRKYLKVLATGIVGAMAGCSGQEGEAEPTTQSNTPTESTPTTTSTATSTTTTIEPTEEPTTTTTTEAPPSTAEIFEENLSAVYAELDWARNTLPELRERTSQLRTAVKDEILRYRDNEDPFETWKLPDDVTVDDLHTLEDNIQELESIIVDELDPHYRDDFSIYTQTEARQEYIADLETYIELGDEENFKGTFNSYIGGYDGDIFTISSAQNVPAATSIGWDWLRISTLIDPKDEQSQIRDTIGIGEEPDLTIVYEGEAFTDLNNAPSAERIQTMYSVLPATDAKKTHIHSNPFSDGGKQLILDFDSADEAATYYQTMLNTVTKQGQRASGQIGEVDRIAWSANGTVWYSFSKQFGPYVVIFGGFNKKWDNADTQDSWLYAGQ